MKRICLVVVILSALCARSSFARVGESWEDVEKRYGHQVFMGLKDPFGNRQIAYEFKDLLIVVTFIDKISVCEEFTKKEKTDRLSPQEIEAILNANAPVWKSDNLLGWDSADGKLRAIHGLGELQIATKEYTEKIAAHNKAERENKLKGF